MVAFAEKFISKFSSGKLLTALAALNLPLWLLALGGWAVQTIALALVERKQSGNSHFLMFDWFVTALVIVTLLLLPAHLLARRSSPGITALIAVCAVLTILRTNVWNNARLSTAGTGGAGSTSIVQVDSLINPGVTASLRRIQTLFAGYLITSFALLLLLLGFGNLPASSAQDAEYISRKAKGAAGHHDNNRVGDDSFPNTNGTGAPHHHHNNGVAPNNGFTPSSGNTGPYNGGADRIQPAPGANRV